MKLALLSPSKTSTEEPALVTEFFNNGLDLFHLRKPDMNLGQMSEYLHQIPKKFWPQIVLHSNYPLVLRHHIGGIHVGKRKKKKSYIRTKLTLLYYKFRNKNLTVSSSFSNLSSLFEDEHPYDYVFLSPIFDSISKSGYQSGFVHHNLQIALNKTSHKVYALGGVSLENISAVYDMGFDGMVLSGIIWQSEDKLDVFKKIAKAKAELDKQKLSSF
jgi:thiamine-phosphate pyrophosphorylase